MSQSLLQRHAINWRKGSRTSPLLRARATRSPGQKQTTCFAAPSSAKQHHRTTQHTRYEAVCWQKLAQPSVHRADPCDPRHRRSCEVGLSPFAHGTDYLEHILRRDQTDITLFSCCDICVKLAPCRCTRYAHGSHACRFCTCAACICCDGFP